MSVEALAGLLDRELDGHFRQSRDALSVYRDDPVGFGRDILGESYAPDIEAMMRSVSENTITVAESANGVGKTHGAARVAYWFYQCHSQVEVYTCAAGPITNLERILWGEIGSLASRHKYSFPQDAVSNLEIKRDDENFIVGVTIPRTGSSANKKAEFSGKHSPHLMFICDEGDAVPDEVYEGIETCMSGGLKIRLLVLYNPRYEAGRVWRMVDGGLANVVQMSAFRHPNVVTGDQVYPGAVTRDVTLRRIAEWTAPVVGMPGPGDGDAFKVPEYLVGERLVTSAGASAGLLGSGWRRVLDAQFPYMVLGRYPLAGMENAYFDRTYLVGRLRQIEEKSPVARAGDLRDLFVGYSGSIEVYADPDPSMRYVIGVDVSEGIASDEKSHDYSAVDVACAETHAHVCSLWGRIDPTELGEILDWLGREYNEAWIGIERSPHAIATIGRLQELGYTRLYAHRVVRSFDGLRKEETQIGYPNTLRAKVLRNDTLARAIREVSLGYDGFVLNGKRGIEECMFYVKKPAGKAGGLGSRHDDHVTSLGIASVLLSEGGPPASLEELAVISEGFDPGVRGDEMVVPSRLYGG